MNEVNGYYSCSINPCYVSTWYTSLLPRRHFDISKGIFDNSPVVSSKFQLPVTDPTGFEHYSKTSANNPVPVNFADNSHRGRISPIALRKIRKAIDYTVFLAAPKALPDTVHGRNFNFRLNFITLTLSSSQVHSDLVIKNKILQPMLNCFRQKYKVINYVWRAEKQGNGNIHFHIVTDKFIPWNELRNDWNKFQQGLGYVTRYRDQQIEFHKNGFKIRTELLKTWSYEKQHSAYVKSCKNEWNNPNSTDVHSLRTVTNVKQYFVKYLTKDEQSSATKPGTGEQYSLLTGRLWGCSSRLTNIPGARADLDTEITAELLKLKSDPGIRTFQTDFFSISFIDIEKLAVSGYRVLPGLFEHYIKNTFPEYRPPDLFS